MSRSTQDLLTGADPAPTAAVDALDLGGADDALRDAILRVNAADAAPLPKRRRRSTAPPTRRRRRWPALVGASAALAVAAVFAFANIERIDQASPAPSEAWAAAAVKVAKAVPRLLPSEPGWAVSRADEFDVDYGEFELAKGNRAVQLTWYRRDQYDSYFKDRQDGTERFDDTQVAGEQAAVFRYEKSDDYFAMWKTGKHFIEARVQPDIPPEWRNKPMPAGEGMGGPTFVSHFTEASFREFLSTLEPATIDAWLSAMPPSVVKPGESAKAIDQMLEDVPTPKGFDRSRLVDESATRDVYQLGAKVIGSVTCSWLRQWVRAIRSGDATARAEAIAAMETSRDWKILKTMSSDGAYPAWIWEIADRMKTDAPDSPAGGGKVTLEQDFESSLGCLEHVR